MSLCGVIIHETFEPGGEAVDAKKGIIALVAVFALYMLITAPAKSADMVRTAGSAAAGAAGTVADSLFTFLDRLV
jgi:hypothetical protein